MSGADHVTTNRRYWDEELAGPFGERARRHWAAGEPFWGIWGIPQSRLPVLPAELAGTDAVELGCGTGYVSAWLAPCGARPVGIDMRGVGWSSTCRTVSGSGCCARAGCW